MRLNAKDFGIVKEAVVTGVPMLVFMATNFVKALGLNTIIMNQIGEDGMAVFTVKDDGVGMSQEQLEKLMGTEEEPDHEAERTHTHLGVYAVRKRLDYVYQNKARMSITSEPGKGTQVILEIPMNGNVGVTYRKCDEPVNENNKKRETRDNGIAGNDIR